MEYNFRKVNEKDGTKVIDIFNYYIENSFAAFPEKKLSHAIFQPLLEMAKGYPFYVIEKEADGVIGFGFIGRYHQSEVFDRVAELTYFILPPYTKKRLGTRLFNILINEAKEMGIETLLASITSLNKASIDFHLAHGFKECGRFENIGKKQNTDFDVVWMQKFI
ncbi:MAG: GNAT family N-acetyltransferase [Syntrophomonadaceae bacterium]|nr:GNAT family N-acetyltransferase [Syntrophomonadaceae bacterium]